MSCSTCGLQDWTKCISLEAYNLVRRVLGEKEKEKGLDGDRAPHD